MKRTGFFICFLLLCILIFNQCKKRELGKLLGTYSFTQQDLKIVPYSGGEILTLVDSLGDTIHYNIQTPKYTDSIKVYNFDHEITPDNIDYEDYYYVEEAQIFDHDGAFLIELHFTSPFETPLLKLFYIETHIKSHPEINSFECTSCEFDNGNLYQFSDPLFYNDSITLVNHKFYYVYRLTSTNFDAGSSTENIQFLYYSVNQGLVGLRTTTGHIWRLN